MSPTRGRRGIGTALHELAVAEMRLRRYRRAELRTPKGAAPARAFYARAGWIETGSTHAEELGLDLVIFELDLDEAASPVRGP